MAKKHDIIWLDSIDSTNEEARRRTSALDNLSVLSALSQTAGRGQRGNTWSAKPGENLTFSIVLKYGPGATPEIRAWDQSVISEITALSVVDFLGAHGIGTKIKWPNDIYAGDRKICGILIEHSVRNGLLSSSIIGIGLNVNQRNFDVNLPNPTSMALSLDQTLSLPGLLEDFMQTFRGYWRRYLNITGGQMQVRRLYLSQMWRKDSPARYLDTVSGKEFIGIIRGLSDIGHLVVEDTEKGELKEFAFKEISYII